MQRGPAAIPGPVRGDRAQGAEPMLVLSRKPMQRIVIGDNIRITVVGLDGGRVRLGIDAPPQVSVLRGELIAQGGTTDGAVEADANVAPRRSIG